MTFQELVEVTTSIVSLGGGGAIVFGLSGYLGRVWADRALENSGRKTRLTSQLGLITEERRRLLQLRQWEHQVRFSNMHVKRGEVIGLLYADLADTLQIVREYVIAKRAY